MRNNSILFNMVLDLLVDAVIDQSKVHIRDKNRIIDIYDDASGQRGAYLSFFSYTNHGINTEKQDERCPNTFYVRRRLSFVNEGDEGKEDAILLTLHADNIKKAQDISIKGNTICIDDLEINIYKP